MAKIRRTTSIQSGDEFAHEVDTIARLEVGLAKTLASQDKWLQKVRERYAKIIDKIKNERDTKLRNVLCYATINRAELTKKGRKSAETALATWGWRTAPPSLLIVKGRNWADVSNDMQAMDSPYSDMFIFGAPKPDKNRIKNEMPSDVLSALGLKVEPKEDFFVIPKDSTIEELCAKN